MLLPIDNLINISALTVEPPSLSHLSLLILQARLRRISREKALILGRKAVFTLVAERRSSR